MATDKSKEAMKLALEALEQYTNVVASVNNPDAWVTVVDAGKPAREAISALREALAEQPACEHEWLRGGCLKCGQSIEQPAQQQESVAWVYPEGLDALKNGKPWTAYGTKQAANNTALYLHPTPEREPYAWVTFTPYGEEDDVWYENPEGKLLEGWTYKPLYDTAQPQRTFIELTEAEIDEICLGDEAVQDATEAKLREKNHE